MTPTKQIEAAFRDAGRPLTREEVLDATGLEDATKVQGLIYYLVNAGRLSKAAPATDGASRWTHRVADEGERDAPPAVNILAEVKVPNVAAFKAQQREMQPQTVPIGSAPSVMTASIGQDALPHVCVNFGTGAIVISCRDDVIRIDSLAAAQNLQAQMQQAITALGALDGRRDR